VFRLAREHALTGWVLNAESGVEMHLEGSAPALDAFLRDLKEHPPRAATIDSLDVAPAALEGFRDFTIRASSRTDRPTVRVSPDLCVCPDCLSELFDADNARAGYPYINCTNCGPRYSIIEDLPYDRAQTTMRWWRLCSACEAQYQDVNDRRFHAQPTACPECGPRYSLRNADGQPASLNGVDPIAAVAALITQGRIVAIKGLGGYHLSCDANNAGAVGLLRARKFRKEQPFALMARNVDIARRVVHLTDAAVDLLESIARPIVLAPALKPLAAVAPDNRELGVMLPYAPLHHLLFARGAPPLLVMTSANRSGEPLAYQDDDAFDRLSGIADAFLVGERPIARRVDDSVIRIGPLGPTILRRARGYAPGAVATLPTDRPVLALGADLKNTVTLVVGGQAFMSQYIGDLEDARTAASFEATIRDLMRLYDVSWKDVIVACDAHPGYRSTAWAERLPAGIVRAIQHHRAHIASVLAERQEWDARVVGASFDGTGYGDDGSTWGGEIFVGSVRDGFDRIGRLRPVRMAGGDAAARHPVQAAAGFIEQLDEVPDLAGAPFHFPSRFVQASALLRAGIRVGASTSMGRLFDALAALVGFTRPTTFEGQAAIWLEHLAGTARTEDACPFPFENRELDFRPLLEDVIRRRLAGEPPAEIARAAQRGIAHGTKAALAAIAMGHGIKTAVVSGGVFQNHLLLNDLHACSAGSLRLWTNRRVPPNDGGVSLGQAALASLGKRGIS
jgi:hydrogenase maturation protein HypF